MAELIVALDVDALRTANQLVNQLNPRQCALKIGSEMFTRFGFDFIDTLTARGFKVFLDLKFHDIPVTVAKACVAAAERGVWMINIHASGGLCMMQTAREALEASAHPAPLLIAVTILTSLSTQDLATVGMDGSVSDQVVRLAALAHTAGLDGVVSSVWEVPLIKAACGEAFLTVTPGIRLKGHSHHDQQRVASIHDAVRLGSDYLVVGRNITEAQDPATVIAQIMETLRT